MNKQFPLVSVTMPVYNAEKYLKMAIDSILNQTYKNFELVIVNDGSSDSSKEIIHTYSDDRIRYFENQVNLGISKTRNRCVEQAAGKYIAVLDNDDIAMPDRLEKQVEFLESNPDYGICGSFYELIDGDGHLICKMKLPVSNKEVKTYLIFDNCFCNSSVMFHGDLLKVDLYAEGFDMIEDYYFLYSVSKIRKLFILPLILTQYRVHGSNTSIQKLGGMRSVRKKMDNLVLHDLGLSYTEAEFTIHTDFFTSNAAPFKDIKHIRELETWLLKLYGFLESKHQYDMGLIEKIFIRRWILLFKRNGNISYRTIYNRIFRKFKFKYLGYFFELLKEKISINRSVA